MPFITTIVSSQLRCLFRLNAPRVCPLVPKYYLIGLAIAVGARYVCLRLFNPRCPACRLSSLSSVPEIGFYVRCFVPILASSLDDIQYVSKLVSPPMPKKLINKVLEDCSIRRALKYTRQQDSIFAVYRQYLVPLVTIEVGYLQ